MALKVVVLRQTGNSIELVYLVTSLHSSDSRFRESFMQLAVPC
jgi:hypothetical protein